MWLLSEARRSCQRGQEGKECSGLALHSALDTSLLQSQRPQTLPGQAGDHQLSLGLPEPPALPTAFYVNSGVPPAGSEFCLSAALWLLDEANLKLVHDDPDTHSSSETTRELRGWRGPVQGSQAEIYSGDLGLVSR